MQIKSLKISVWYEYIRHYHNIKLSAISQKLLIEFII